jgi:maltose alpha-D-glucosyltransferase / alpha-amylase
MNNWFKNAVMYTLDLKTFQDTNGDGIGDLPGLISRLNYLASLGITCLWLKPFHPSPKVDDGYDVADYYNVDSDFGDLGDFVHFIREAKKYGIRVIMDLVVNHTSTEHYWFKNARSSREAEFRDFYVWKENPDRSKDEVLLEGIEDSLWEYTEETGCYYLHHYFTEQADLNMTNPQVRREILKIMDFWLQMGVSGFRVDAAHVVTNTEQIDHTDYENLHTFFGEMRNFLAARDPEAVLLGETSMPPDELAQYFVGDAKTDQRMHMLFNFIGNKYMMLALARQDGHTLMQGMRLYKAIDQSHWVNFIRHHDELNMELLSEEERKEVFEAFAPKEDMRMFGHGIRRRLPPMLQNDIKRIKLTYALTFGMPGTPLLNYGEELGMGDDLNLEGRKSVRTPMQWCIEPNAGFSNAPADKLYYPIIEKGEYGYKKLNMREQMSNPDSLLTWMARLARLRLLHPEIGQGKWSFVNINSKKAIAIEYILEEHLLDRTLIVINNLHEKPVTLTLTPSFKPIKTETIYSDAPYENDHTLQEIKLNGFGYRWIQIIEKK